MTYLAFRGAEILLIFGAGVFLAYLITRRSNRDRDLQRRIDLVERALDSGQIDEHTKRELLAAATAPVGTHWHPALVAGWVGLFSGLGMIALALMYYRDWWETGIMVTAVSLGVISVPIGMRELQGRAAHTTRSD